MITSRTISSLCNYGNHDIYFTIRQHDIGSDVTMETTSRCWLYDKNDLKSLLSLGINDLCILLSRFVDFHGIWYGWDVIQANLDAIILNAIASTIVKSHHCCVFSCSIECSIKVASLTNRSGNAARPLWHTAILWSDQNSWTYNDSVSHWWNLGIGMLQGFS
jgi:hypothetical protein